MSDLREQLENLLAEEGVVSMAMWFKQYFPIETAFEAWNNACDSRHKITIAPHNIPDIRRFQTELNCAPVLIQRDNGRWDVFSSSEEDLVLLAMALS